MRRSDHFASCRIGGSPAAAAPSIALACLLTLALAACTPVDGDQARLCRIALPALEEPGTRIAVSRVRPIEGGVHIAYRAIAAAGTSHRFAECRFAPGRRAML